MMAGRQHSTAPGGWRRHQEIGGRTWPTVRSRSERSSSWQPEPQCLDGSKL